MCYNVVIYRCTERMEQNLSFLDFNIDDLPEELCRLRLPKFKIENDLDLNYSLEKHGMTTMFMSGTANFEDIAKNVSPPLYESDVFKRCMIDVNERGTEASAFTYVRLRGGGIDHCVPKYTKININKPFLYMIKYEDKIIFIGRDCNPRD